MINLNTNKTAAKISKNAYPVELISGIIQVNLVLRLGRAFASEKYRLRDFTEKSLKRELTRLNRGLN
jgi:hypothetical protein